MRLSGTTGDVRVSATVRHHPTVQFCALVLVIGCCGPLVIPSFVFKFVITHSALTPSGCASPPNYSNWPSSLWRPFLVATLLNNDRYYPQTYIHTVNNTASFVSLFCQYCFHITYDLSLLLLLLFFFFTLVLHSQGVRH